MALGPVLGHHLGLLFGIADPGRDHRAAEGAGRIVKDPAAGREMVGEGILDDIAPAQPGGVERPRAAVKICARAHDLEDRPRRGEGDGGVAQRHCVEPGERRRGLLRFDQAVLAGDRQGGQCLAGGQRRRIDIGQAPRVPVRRGFCVRDLRGQRLHERNLALSRIAGFEGVVMVGHGRFPELKSRHPGSGMTTRLTRPRRSPGP